MKFVDLADITITITITICSFGCSSDAWRAVLLAGCRVGESSPVAASPRVLVQRGRADELGLRGRGLLLAGHAGLRAGYSGPGS